VKSLAVHEGARSTSQDEAMIARVQPARRKDLQRRPLENETLKKRRPRGCGGNMIASQTK
jgi:hypothetical protein